MNNAAEIHRHDTRGADDGQDEHKSPARLEAEVDQARLRLGRTVNELSDRLSPGELIDQALGMAREHGGAFGRNLGNQVKQNPIPMILTGVGICWMMMSSGSQAPVPHGTNDGSTDEDGRSVKGMLGDAAEATRNKAAAVGNRVHGATANVKESAQHARDSLVQFYREQPLLAGSVGIAIGAALGALVPPTEIEDEMLGEASDRSVAAARSTTESKYDEIRESARPD